MENYKSLDLLLDPVFVISEDYKILYQNKASKESFGNLEGQVCYKSIFGFSDPCWKYGGYRCPVKGINKKALTQLFEVKFSDQTVKRFCSRIYHPEKLIVEFLVPYEEIVDILDSGKLIKSKDEFYLSKEEFIALLKKKLNEGRTFFLTTLNIKGLKKINEIHGIWAGDLVIKAVESVLFRLVTKYKFKFTQLSGGFWVILLEIDRKKLLSLEHELKEEFKKIAVIFAGVVIKPKVTITTLEILPSLIREIDQILQLIIYSESVRPNGIYFFLSKEKTKQFLNYLKHKQKVLKELYQFLEERRITFYLHPIVNLKTKKIAFFEVLLRLVGKNGEIIPAGKYIDLIYEHHLITDFDLLLLEKLEERIEDLAKLKRQISINVSDYDLKLFLYREKLKNLLKKFESFGIQADLEITEQILFKEFSFLSELGKWYNLKYTIDDFGTGYSSLKLVLELVSRKMANKLKVDCSLVRDILEDSYNRGLIETIVTFANKIDLKVVVECVETEEQFRLLKKLGVHYGQGWYFYKPLPLEEAIELIRAGK